MTAGDRRWRGAALGGLGALVALLMLVLAFAPSLFAASQAAVRTRTVAAARIAAARHIYWTNPETSRGAGGPGINTVGRANLDGSGVNKGFIATSDIPGAVAVNSRYIYWANTEAGTIGRARLDGSHVRESFLRVRASAGAIALGGRYIYWTAVTGSAAMIGRANLDGTHVKRCLINIGKGTFIGGLALDRRRLYWTNRDNGTIGRVNLNGSHMQRRWITGAVNPTGLALGGGRLGGGRLWWDDDVFGSTTSGTIGTAKLNGTHVNESFITGLDEPFGIAVTGQRIYWTNFGSGTIGRAAIDGTHVEQSFILAGEKMENGEGSPMGLAVGP